MTAAAYRRCVRPPAADWQPALLGEARGAAAAEPGAPPTASSSTAPAQRGPAAGREQPLVLIADDDRELVQSLALLLEINGYAAITAHDGREAVEAVERERPDIVLLDIGMPGLDGHVACKRIRQMPDGERLRIFALTGWGEEHDRRRSVEAGFDDHLVKPVEAAALLALLALG
jgi:CheY-like chemotaxis protein